MKKLQMKYNFLHIFYWIASGALCAYVAVFLQYKGMNKTEIGIVTGGHSLLTIFLSPFLSGLITMIPSLTIKKLMTGIYIFLMFAFLAVTFLNLPEFLIIILYMCMMAFEIQII